MVSILFAASLPFPLSLSLSPITLPKAHSFLQRIYTTTWRWLCRRWLPKALLLVVGSIGAGCGLHWGWLLAAGCIGAGCWSHSCWLLAVLVLYWCW
jgi:hypothetical protein